MHAKNTYANKYKSVVEIRILEVTCVYKTFKYMYTNISIEFTCGFRAVTCRATGTSQAFVIFHVIR